MGSVHSSCCSVLSSFCSVLSSCFSSPPPPLPLPPSPSPPPEIKYDVFLSFRGDDTRNNFTSHLHTALRDKGIDTFIDYKLRSGDEISPALLQAIEESQITIIIFSKHYASSRWCLEELVKILECKKNHGQIVIPVFHEIDPSDVRNQTGTFADAFASHQRRFKENLDKVQKWRCDLKEAANLSGFDSRVVKPESILVEKIVQDVLERLNNMPPSDDNEELVGIESRIMEIELALGVGDQTNKDVRRVGIWGIGGIGKTTLAKAVFDKIFYQFEGSYFFHNVREAFEKKDLTSLRQELHSAILRDENANGYTFTKKRLSRKKLLIVFDDVLDFDQVEKLIGELDCVGSGSRIIITTRDQQVLKNLGVDPTFKIEDLNVSDSLKLFCLRAFKQNRPKVDYKELSKCVVQMVGGVPLALKVLGSTLLGKSEKVWGSLIKKLSYYESLDERIHEKLKISYDGLDHDQQRIFLDIACFHKGCNINEAIAIMDASDYDISVLIDKSLIFISNNKLMMHDLLQAMGKEIVRQESFDDPGKRSRLWHHKKISDILTNATGTETIEGISLDMSRSTDIYLHPKALANMPKMTFLKFSCAGRNKVHAWLGLQYVSAKLRYFCWYDCPLKSLQSYFHLKNLVMLKIPYSDVEELWTGVQQFDHLKHIDLHGSKNLITIPNLSLAPNLERLFLDGCSKLKKLSEIPSKLERLYFGECESLIELPSSFKRVKYLDFTDCKSLTSIPDFRGWESLKQFHLSNCLKIKMLPKLPNSIEELHLSNILIEELPMSYQQDLCKLRILCFADCKRLKSLPSNVCEWKSLEQLMLFNCPKIGKLPDDLETLENLFNLTVRKTAVREVPESIINLSDLKRLDISYCKRLEVLPKLQYSPKRFPWAEIIASNCSSLEKLSSPLFCHDFFAQNGDMNSSIHVDLGNCRNLDRNSLDNFQKNILQNIKGLAASSKKRYSRQDFDGEMEPCEVESCIFICYPESEIPEWFEYQTDGSFIDVSLPKDSFNYNFLCFAVCVVVAFDDDDDDDDDYYKDEAKFDIDYQCTNKSEDHTLLGTMLGPEFPDHQNYRSNHVIFRVGFHHFPTPCDNGFTFQFFSLGWLMPKIEKCGVHLLFGKHLEISDESEDVDKLNLEESD